MWNHILPIAYPTYILPIAYPTYSFDTLALNLLLPILKWSVTAWTIWTGQEVMEISRPGFESTEGSMELQLCSMHEFQACICIEWVWFGSKCILFIRQNCSLTLDMCCSLWNNKIARLTTVCSVVGCGAGQLATL